MGLSHVSKCRSASPDGEENSGTEIHNVAASTNAVAMKRKPCEEKHSVVTCCDENNITVGCLSAVTIPKRSTVYFVEVNFIV